MDKRIAAIGGMLLITGGLAWYFLQKEKPPLCSNYISQSACEFAGCFWYDNSCHSTPPGVECSHLLPGSDPGYGFPPGWRKCDPIDGDLCEWDGSRWNLIELSSPDCLISHRKCYVSTSTNYMTCGNYPGTGADGCSAYAESCSCIVGNCQPNTICCTKDNICRLTAYNNVINANSTNMICDESDPGNHFCTYPFIQNLGRPLVATSLVGNLHYIWGPYPSSWGDVRVWAWYNGNRTKLFDQGIQLFTEGDIAINIYNIHECIDALEFNLASWGTNIHIETFIGHINY